MSTFDLLSRHVLHVIKMENGDSSSAEQRSRSLVGLALSPESSSEPVHVFGVVLVKEETQALSLAQFREVACSTNELRSILPSKFMFVTQQGWNVTERLESALRLSDVISRAGQVLIRVAREQNRVGIKVLDLGQNHYVAVGFIFCDLSISLVKFRNEMKTQLSHLPDAFHGSVVLMDHNLWPVSREQEPDLVVCEAMVSGAIHCQMLSHGRLAGIQFDSLTKCYPSSAQLEQSDTGYVSHSFVPHWHSGTDLTRSNLPPVSGPVATEPAMGGDSPGSSPSFDIVISYVRVEAYQYATQLKAALKKLGFKVFLDADEIFIGCDWQDVLNDSIATCRLFVALITPRYGETLWTNREIKLADILGKTIVPVNFIDSWPPKCLAIQFSTTQFIPSKGHSEEWDSEEAVTWVASEIQAKHEPIISAQSFSDSEGSTFSSASYVADETDGSALVNSLPVPVLPKKPTLRSCPTMLPRQTNPKLAQLLRQPREGQALILVLSHSAQEELKTSTVTFLKSLGHDVETTDEGMGDDPKKMQDFQRKVDESGVVVIIASKEFTQCESCSKQVYYCEQRVRIIPVIAQAFRIPLWLARLIGTNTFVQASSDSYHDGLKEHIQKSLQPINPEKEAEEMKKKELRLDQLKQEVLAKVPTSGRHIYVSGGTQFFSEKGEEVCKELGRALAEHPEVVLVTGGFYGVGETVGKSFHDARLKAGLPSNVWHVTAVKDEMDKSSQTRQNKDGTFLKVPYGETVFVGDSIRERETLIGCVLHTCVLIEGGPGASYEAEQFAWNGGLVVPLKMTGGAASGIFGLPGSIFNCPPGASKSDWDLLGDTTATPSQVAEAATRLVLQLTSDALQEIPGNSRAVPKDAEDVAFEDSSGRKRPWSLANGDTMPIPSSEPQETQ